MTMWWGEFWGDEFWSACTFLPLRLQRIKAENRAGLPGKFRFGEKLITLSGSVGVALFLGRRDF